MKNIVITGGSDGMGKVTALHFLKKGDCVIVVGSTAAKGQRFLEEAKSLGAADRAHFIQADLSLISENQRVMQDIRSRFDSLDMLVLCAGKFQTQYVETSDGIETIFATYYLSRYLLSYGLRDLLEKAEQPMILNVAAPGMKGELQWDDLGFKANFNALKASFHGSRLNDLLAVGFAENNQTSRIRYILYNPGFVGTDGVTKAFPDPLRRTIVKVAVRLMGKSPEEGAQPIIQLLEHPPQAALAAFQQRKLVNFDMSTFDKAKAARLFDITEKLLAEQLQR
jgi:NAD(P)-dependent dehydrogenase (short-subunit alcohol dehydrogenase family)